LQWLFVKGQLTATELQSEHDLVKQVLAAGDAHLQEFLNVWNQSS